MGDDIKETPKNNTETAIDTISTALAPELSEDESTPNTSVDEGTKEKSKKEPKSKEGSEEETISDTSDDSVEVDADSLKKEVDDLRKIISTKILAELDKEGKQLRGYIATISHSCGYFEIRDLGIEDKE